MIPVHIIFIALSIETLVLYKSPMFLISCVILIWFFYGIFLTLIVFQIRFKIKSEIDFYHYYKNDSFFPSNKKIMKYCRITKKEKLNPNLLTFITENKIIVFFIIKQRRYYLFSVFQFFFFFLFIIDIYVILYNFKLYEDIQLFSSLFSPIFVFQIVSFGALLIYYWIEYISYKGDNKSFTHLLNIVNSKLCYVIINKFQKIIDTKKYEKHPKLNVLFTSLDLDVELDDYVLLRMPYFKLLYNLLFILYNFISVGFLFSSFASFVNTLSSKGVFEFLPLCITFLALLFLLNSYAIYKDRFNKKEDKFFNVFKTIKFSNTVNNAYLCYMTYFVLCFNLKKIHSSKFHYYKKITLRFNNYDYKVLLEVYDGNVHIKYPLLLSQNLI